MCHSLPFWLSNPLVISVPDTSPPDTGPSVLPGGTFTGVVKGSRLPSLIPSSLSHASHPWSVQPLPGGFPSSRLVLHLSCSTGETDQTPWELLPCLLKWLHCSMWFPRALSPLFPPRQPPPPAPSRPFSSVVHLLHLYLFSQLFVVPGPLSTHHLFLYTTSWGLQSALAFSFPKDHRASPEKPSRTPAVTPPPHILLLCKMSWKCLGLELGISSY